MTYTPTLEEMLDEIARLTGLSVCVYDLSFFTRESPEMEVPHRLRVHDSPYCKKIKSHPEAWQRCIETQYERAAEAARRDEPFLHTCHAGLTDLVVPLRLGQRQIGALYLGQTVTEDPSRVRAVLRDVSRRYEFSLKELQALLKDKMPHTSPAALQAHAVLLYLLKHYIEREEESHAMADDVEAPVAETLRTRVPIEQVPTPILDAIRPHSASVRSAVRLLKNSYWKKIDLSTVAREVGLSQSHFSRQFRAEAGMPFRECLLKTRTGAARYLLKKSDYTVAEIARVLGYSSAPAFVRAFQVYTNCSPHEYQRRQAFPMDFGGRAQKVNSAANSVSEN